MKKQTIRLTESQIRNIVKATIRESLLNERIERSVNSVINEMMEEIQPGMSISHGTMRMIDVLPAMYNTLNSEAPEAAQQFMANNPEFAQMLQKLEDEGESGFNYGNADPWWESEEAYWAYEDLESELDKLAPEGHYFGAHPGDSSDLGFWPNELGDF